ncbi:MAG TPA: glycogen-binding domain-containing protein [Terriglobales bacterium]|nr:glycogen-binding domain-containing protein [Terriglobales bacterium]
MYPKQTHTADHGVNPVAFVCHPSTAEAVFLAGSFNGWDPTATPMMLGKDGQWTVSLTLAPGRYEYKFVVDGEWCCEPDCTALSPEGPHCIMNDFGTMNCVLEVK